jgi:hypothetical protein
MKGTESTEYVLSVRVIFDEMKWNQKLYREPFPNEKSAFNLKVLETNVFVPHKMQSKRRKGKKQLNSLFFFM